MHNYGIVYYNFRTEDEIRLRTKGKGQILVEREARKHVPEGYELWGVFYQSTADWILLGWFLKEYPQTLEDWLMETGVWPKVTKLDELPSREEG